MRIEKDGRETGGTREKKYIEQKKKADEGEK